MRERRTAAVDRRTGTDRRRVYKLGYFLNGGVERRTGKERRAQCERRKEWMIASEGVSVLVGHHTTKSALARQYPG
jgi:hypothetical protein